jgi:hypothetical protein
LELAGDIARLPAPRRLAAEFSFDPENVRETVSSDARVARVPRGGGWDTPAKRRFETISGNPAAADAFGASALPRGGGLETPAAARRGPGGGSSAAGTDGVPGNPGVSSRAAAAIVAATGARVPETPLGGAERVAETPSERLGAASRRRRGVAGGLASFGRMVREGREMAEKENKRARR